MNERGEVEWKGRCLSSPIPRVYSQISLNRVPGPGRRRSQSPVLDLCGNSRGPLQVPGLKVSPDNRPSVLLVR